MGDLWMVVEYNQASHWPEEAYGPYDEMGDAYEAAISRAIDTAVIGRREMYRAARLEFVTDFVEIPDEGEQSDGDVGA